MSDPLLLFSLHPERKRYTTADAELCGDTGLTAVVRPVRHYHLAIFVHEPANVAFRRMTSTASHGREAGKGVSPGAVARCSILTGTAAQVPSGAQQREAAHECQGANRVQEGRVRSRKRQRAPRLARAWAFVRALAADPRRRRPRQTGPFTRPAATRGSGRLCGSRMTVAQHGPIRAKGWLPPRRGAGRMRLGGSCRARAAVRRRRAGGTFCQRRWRRELSRGGGSAPTPLAPSMATGRDRPCAALHRFRSHRRASPLGRHLLGRRVLHGGRRRNVESARFGHALRFSARGRALSRFRRVRDHLTLARAVSPLLQQKHCGIYRSDNSGASWRSIENGLPSSFGFPVAAHPRDADTLFFLPLNGDTKGHYPQRTRGRLAIARWRRALG